MSKSAAFGGRTFSDGLDTRGWAEFPYSRLSKTVLFQSPQILAEFGRGNLRFVERDRTIVVVPGSAYSADGLTHVSARLRPVDNDDLGLTRSQQDSISRCS